MADKPKSKALITPNAILSYPHLHQPQPAKAGQKPKYSAALIFTPAELATPDGAAKFKALQDAAVAVGVEKWGKEKFESYLKGENFKKGFRRDAKEGYPEGSVYINVRTEQQPGMVYSWPEAGSNPPKPAKIPLEKVREELYPGARVRASVVAFAFDTDGNRGISFALNNIQKIGDGERIDNRVDASREFDADLSQAPADLSAMMS